MTDAITVMVNPDDRRKLKGMLVEMTECLRKIDDQRDHMKDIAAAIEDALAIKKKHANKLARTMYKHNYADLQAENEHFEMLYETVIEGQTTPTFTAIATTEES